MSKPTVLLIGGLTHTEKEWKAFESKYNLKVMRYSVFVEAQADKVAHRNMKQAAERTS